MWSCANMVWRIGERLDVEAQIAWCRAAGFDGVGVHASAGAPPAWRGIDPLACDAAGRARFRETLGWCRLLEVHAPFAIELRTATLATATAALLPTLDLAHDLGAGIVTVHASLPVAPAADVRRAWTAAVRALDAAAAQRGLVVGLEVTRGFANLVEWNLPAVGATLDVGHVFLAGQGAAAERNAGVAAAVRTLGGRLVHVHLHDVAGAVDHSEIGSGQFDLPSFLGLLRDGGYRGGMALELNPDRVCPAGIERSLARVRETAAALPGGVNATAAGSGAGR